jgi:hypothetical protein
MSRDEDDLFRKPPWNQAAIWTGCDLFALLRILKENRFQVSPSCWLECGIDLALASIGLGFRLANSVFRSRRIQKTKLATDPIIIIGHWRTGTTLLHELLSLDPRHAYPTTFQCFLPTHFPFSERLLKGWSQFALPATRPFDSMSMSWDLPQEDEFALLNMGVRSPYATIAFPNRPPQNQGYLTLDGLSDTEIQHWKSGLTRFLKQVVYKNPGRLVIKSPTHTFRLPTLIEMFPNARLINVVRNPVHVYLSTLRLWKTFYATNGYQKPHFKGLEEYVLTTFSRMHERLEATRHLVPSSRLIDLRFEELVADIPGQMETLYEQLDLGDFGPARDAIDEYVAQRADFERRDYEPTEEVKRLVLERWRPYFERYGYDYPG